MKFFVPFFLGNTSFDPFVLVINCDTFSGIRGLLCSTRRIMS